MRECDSPIPDELPTALHTGEFESAADRHLPSLGAGSAGLHRRLRTCNTGDQGESKREGEEHTTHNERVTKPYAARRRIWVESVARWIASRTSWIARNE